MSVMSAFDFEDIEVEDIDKSNWEDDGERIILLDKSGRPVLDREGDLVVIYKTDLLNLWFDNYTPFVMEELSPLKVRSG